MKLGTSRASLLSGTVHLSLIFGIALALVSGFGYLHHLEGRVLTVTEAQNSLSNSQTVALAAISQSFMRGQVPLPQRTLEVYESSSETVNDLRKSALGLSTNDRNRVLGIAKNLESLITLTDPATRPKTTSHQQRERLSLLVLNKYRTLAKDILKLKDEMGQSQKAIQTRSIEFSSYLVLAITLGLIVESIGVFLPLIRRTKRSQQELESRATELKQRNDELHAAHANLLESQDELTSKQEQLEEFVAQQNVNLELLQFGSQRFQLLFQNLPAVCFTTDAEGTLFEWNAEAERTLGYFGFTIFEQSMVETLIPEDATEEWETVFTHLREGKPVRHQSLPVKHLQGHVVQLLVSAFVLRSVAGGISGMVFSGIEIRGVADDGLELSLLKEAMEHIPDGVCITDEELRIEFVNSAYTAITGYSHDELIGQHPGRMLQSSQTSSVAKVSLREAIQNRKPAHSRILDTKKDGTCYWADLRIVPYIRPGCDSVRFIGFHTPVTDAVALSGRLAQTNHRFALAMQYLKTPLVILDYRGKILDANPAAETILAQSVSDLLGKRAWRAIPLHRFDDPRVLGFENPVVMAIRQRSTIEAETFQSARPLEEQPTYLQPSCILVPHESDPTLNTYMLFLQDETEKVMQQSEIERYVLEIAEQNVQLQFGSHELEELALVDELTRIPNRRGFASSAKQVLSSASPLHPIAVGMLDLDHFKRVNDTYGHAVGDQALVALASTLRQCIGDLGVVGRLSGDEFAFVVPVIDLKVLQDSLEDITPITFEGPNGELTFSMSIGFVVATEPAPLSQVLQLADDAAYVAKQRGRNQVAQAPFTLSSSDQAA